LFKDNLIGYQYPFIKPRGYWTDYFFGDIGYQVILEMYLWVCIACENGANYIFFEL